MSNILKKNKPVLPNNDEPEMSHDNEMSHEPEMSHDSEMSHDNDYWPDTIVVYIATHGTLITERDTTSNSGIKIPKLFDIPKGMTLTKLSAVAPGICNYISVDDSNMIGKIILDTIDEGSNLNLLPFKIGEILRSSDEKDFQMEKKDFYKKKSDDKDWMNYIYHFNKSYKATTYKSKALNKIYSINVLNDMQEDGKFHNKINIMNSPTGIIDFLSFSKMSPYNPDHLLSTLEDLMNFLHSKGSKNVIVIDTACSPIDGISEREERSIRRSLLHNNVLTKRLNKKTKKFNNNTTRKYTKKITNNDTKKYKKKNKTMQTFKHKKRYRKKLNIKTVLNDLKLPVTRLKKEKKLISSLSNDEIMTLLDNDELHG